MTTDADKISVLVEALETGRRAVEKVKREYKRLQPDAALGECWAEVEAFDALLPEALAMAKDSFHREHRLQKGCEEE